MVRKLVIVLLSGIICLSLAVTSALAVKYNEAPMLKVKVAAGELPPVEERLPEEPLVVKPVEAIGRYGGTLKVAMWSDTTWSPLDQANCECLLQINRAGTKPIPNIAKGWDYSDDGLSFTIFLRKGMKWSDGAPFTADDFVWFYEDIVLNNELTPKKPGRGLYSAEVLGIEKVDDYTVRWRFAEPSYRAADIALSGAVFRGGQDDVYSPKHALKKYHIKYNKEANKLAKEEGYEHWWELFKRVRNAGRISVGTVPPEWVGEVPTVAAWVLKKVLPSGTVWERNPYYFAIDTNGNQLPYIDKLQGINMGGNEEIYKAKVLAGDLDYNTRLTTWDISMYPLLKEYEEKGGYRTLLFKGTVSSTAVFLPNQNYWEDPVLGDILRDVRFRRALSLALDRKDINKSLYLGKGTPRQATGILPGSDAYKEEWATAYAQYDPEEAGRLLDEMGLNKWDKEHKYRLRPDGKVLALEIISDGAVSPWTPSAELAKEYWEKVGIQTTVKVIARSLHYEYTVAKKHQISVAHADNAPEGPFVMIRGGHFRAFFSCGSWAVDWQDWVDTNGQKGEEPPEWAKKVISLMNNLPYLEKEERDQALREIGDAQAERVWIIGTVGLISGPATFNTKLGNVYEDGFIDDAAFGGNYHLRIRQYFWKE